MGDITAVAAIGATCFGLAVGYITYRTLVRKDQAAISDIAAVVAAIGGGAVAERFDEKGNDAFAWYSIGLVLGMAIFLVLRLILERSKQNGQAGPVILGD